MRAARRAVVLAGALVCGVPLLAAPEVTPDQVAALLASIDPGYGRYIGAIRYGSTRTRPESIYAGLVRRGGVDPRLASDGPRPERGARHDLIIYADTFEPWRSRAWRLLLADHEYFHARHFARATGLPVVGFGAVRADTDYFEAVAWAYVATRAAEGVYGELAPRERAEAMERYREHREGFRRFIASRQPSAWAHYGRFLPEWDDRVSSGPAAPPAATSPAAGPAPAPATR